MNQNQMQICVEVNQNSFAEDPNPSSSACVSLETEIPESLYLGMKEFISTNPKWSQYRVISTAVANFLFQNGSTDRAVTERYLNDLFSRAEA